VTPYNNLILFNAGSAFAGRLELEYERAVHRLVSVNAAGYLVAFDSIGNENLIGIGAFVGARVYMLGAAPEGLWFGLDVGPAFRTARRDREIRLRGGQIGALLGYTGVWGRFAITGGFGGQFAFGRLEVRGLSTRDSQWNPRFKFGLGVAF
jgi:hypothetical protein